MTNEYYSPLNSETGDGYHVVDLGHKIMFQEFHRESRMFTVHVEINNNCKNLQPFLL